LSLIPVCALARTEEKEGPSQPNLHPTPPVIDGGGGEQLKIIPSSHPLDFTGTGKNIRNVFGVQVQIRL
jgi:hypothetical protein